MSSSGLFGKVLSSNNFLYEDSGNSHHSSTAVVKLGVLLTEFLGRFFIPVVDVSKPDAVVSVKLGGGPPGKFYKSANKKDLKKSSSWELEKSSNSSVDIREFEVVGGGNVSVEDPVIVVYKGSGHGYHSNTAVLALNCAVTGEFVTVSDVSKRIEVSKRCNSSEFFLSNIKLSGSLWKIEKFCKKTVSYTLYLSQR